MNFEFNDYSRRLTADLRRAMGGLGANTRNKLIQRTQRGIDKDGRQFRPYSMAYKQFKQDSGRSVSTVNLTFRFNMLRALRSQPLSSPLGFNIFFDSAEAQNKARSNRSMGRDFMGFDDTLKNDIKDKIDAIIRRVSNG